MFLKFLKSLGENSAKIKKRILYKNLIIILYECKLQDPVNEESNINAFDLNDNFLWNAENCNSGRYFDMQIDEANNTLEADNGGGMFYDIELSGGKIIREMLRK